MEENSCITLALSDSNTDNYSVIFDETSLKDESSVRFSRTSILKIKKNRVDSSNKKYSGSTHHCSSFSLNRTSTSSLRQKDDRMTL